MKLQKSEIDFLACPPTQRDKLFFDEDLKGFGLRVTKSGSKTWLFQYHHKEVGTRRVGLGSYPDLTPHKARQMAERLRASVLTGGNPASERKEARIAKKRQSAIEAFTLEALVKRWDEVGLRDRRESYRSEAKRALTRAFPKQLGKPAEALDASIVREILDKLATSHPTMARRVCAYGRAAYEWARKRQLVAVNPFASVGVEGREVSRDRVLSDVELGEAWRATGKLAGIYRPFVRVLILTLQRRGEVAGMVWAELAEDFSTWTLPADRAKNRHGHVVHLASSASAELEGLTRRARGEYVFETYSQKEKGKKVQISGFSSILEQIKEEIRAERLKHAPATKETHPPLNWTLHDFRRTGVTVMARKGIPPHVADRVLNHIQGAIRGVAAVYQRHDFLAERQVALDLWASHVARVAGQGSADGCE